MYGSRTHLKRLGVFGEKWSGGLEAKGPPLCSREHWLKREYRDEQLFIDDSGSCQAPARSVCFEAPSGPLWTWTDIHASSFLSKA